MTTSTPVAIGEERYAPVELAKIHLDPKDTDRILEDKQALEELAESIRQRGVMQPVGLAAKKGAGGYRVSWGRRRIEAARLAGLKEIPARIVSPKTEQEFLELRETENLQRKDLNPVEEAAAVARLLDLERERAEHAGEIGVGPELPEVEVSAAMIDRVAARIGKSPTWVRDRHFLAKLSGKSRDLVLAGRLPISHAREIAKLADPNLRDQIASEAAIDTSAKEYWQRREHPMELRHLREKVARSLYSLAQVPWNLSVPFADAPACQGCPANSANHPGLFEHHSQFAKKGKYGSHAGDAPAAGVCTNPGCFGRKSKAASAATRSAAKRFLKQHPGAKTVTAKHVEAVTPAHVDRSAVAAVARDLASRPAKEKKDSGAKVRSQAASKPAEKTGPHSRAVKAWEKANDGIEDRCRDQVRAAIASNPEAAVWALASQVEELRLDSCSAYFYDEAGARTRVEGIRKAEKQAQGSDVSKMIELITAGPTSRALEIFRAAAGQKKDRGRRYRSWELYLDGPMMNEPVAGRILRALGVDVEYRSIEGFLAAELEKTDAAKKPPKPSGKKKAKASGKKKKKAEPGVCRECGCTEEDCSDCVEATGEPCSWVELDLCSRCAAEQASAPDEHDLDGDDEAPSKPRKKKAAKKKARGRAAKKGA